MVIDDKESIDGCIKIDINGNYFNNKEGKIMMIFGDGLISFVWFLWFVLWVIVIIFVVFLNMFGSFVICDMVFVFWGGLLVIE